MISAVIFSITGEPSSRLKDKEEVGASRWKALQRIPRLRFDLGLG